MADTKLAYELDEAAMQSSQGLRAIRNAIDAGELRRVYVGTKPIVLHVDLVAWLLGLPESPQPVKK